MNNRENRSAAPMIGGSSLLVIFAVLCLTVFALLGLSTVQADGRLSDASAESVLAYYTADCRGEEILAKLRNGEIPDGVQVDGNVYTYACAISPTSALLVQVQLQEEDYRVLCWKAVSTTEWSFDESLSVWDGET